ncbi:SMI1/KNR4 family protein [Streptomyces sp. NBC_00091]|uniref:SMI1/KNR4 family protein n=1 Tax=Streptomyces sp. NBC_00091 TaxID=2975648 RepID=UPI00225632C4|nr:SMI1/KNR4 family protein [Streptomyces sp. NBC_00091]MCX5374933.1 SMI1/KNR4 family protein [Streptomyces sp. NBC_00091]MCX5380234.1 SMI1/KNR4 family protein [Streptomyces sp. NBC_00091]
MSDTFDVAEFLAGGCRERADAWAFVSAFAASWFTPLSPADGFTLDQVQRAEDRLGVHLPVALREAYTLFGRRRDLVAQQDPLLEPEELLFDPSGELLVFRSENQGCAGWGVSLTDLHREDPPVALFSDRLPNSGRRRFLDRLSLACVETVLSEAVVGRWRQGRACQATPEVVACLETEFARVPLPPYPAWFEPMGPGVRWFSAAGLLLRLEPGSEGTELVVTGQTEGDLQRAIEAIPGAWPDAEPTVTRTISEHDLVLPF